MFNRFKTNHLAGAVTIPLAAIVLAVAIALMPWPWLRYSLAQPLLWVLPGLGWMALLPRYQLQSAERVAVALGLSFVVTPVTVLLLTYLPGPLTATQLLVAMVFLSSVPALAAALLRRRREKNQIAGPLPAEETATTQSEQARSRWRLALIGLGLALLLAMGLRFINLGYSEFHQLVGEICNAIFWQVVIIDKGKVLQIASVYTYRHFKHIVIFDRVNQ